MTEIEKMYENAGINKRCCANIKFEDCIYLPSDCGYYNYPDFTAEKQIKLIKFLLDKYCDIRIRKNLEGAYYITSFNDISCFSENFEETLASFTNTHLQDLTDQEKEEIRNILNENI